MLHCNSKLFESFSLQKSAVAKHFIALSTNEVCLFCSIVSVQPNKYNVLLLSSNTLSFVCVAFFIILYILCGDKICLIIVGFYWSSTTTFTCYKIMINVLIYVII